mmetsp:Transcript_131421/g.185391  ORF Transcript_131421/g.185391 Transcript_131421/m.185391 type:complete len:295 (-) Transcript_131421:349-1233(-)
MRSVLGYTLVAALAAAAASTAFSQIARTARGGETDVQARSSGVSIKLDAPAKPTEAAASQSESKSGSDALLAALFGGVAGLVAAAAEAAQGFFKQRVEPWSPAKEIGATQPLEFFDPLDLAEDEEKFRKFRTAEIKHGRVAMMAAAGAVVQHYVKLPFLKDVPSGVTALQTTKGLLAAGVLFAACGYVETKVWKQDEAKEPGNFGDPAGWSQTGLGAGAYSKTMRERELNNGRFAMFAIVGIIAGEVVSGKDAIEQLTLKTPQPPTPVLAEVTAQTPVLAEVAAQTQDAVQQLQ